METPIYKRVHKIANSGY